MVQQYSNLYIYAAETNQRVVEDDEDINQLEVGTQNPASYISIKDFMKLIWLL
jgi:hypothetical protein